MGPLLSFCVRPHSTPRGAVPNVTPAGAALPPGVRRPIRVPLLCYGALVTVRPRTDASRVPPPQVTAMPGIRFAEVRALVSLADVLDLVGFSALEASRGQVRGRCPVHRPASARSRSFSANLKRNIYRCFTCGSSGNQLDLYAAVTGLSLFDAAVALCERLHRDIPWVQRW